MQREEIKAILIEAGIDESNDNFKSTIDKVLALNGTDVTKMQLKQQSKIDTLTDELKKFGKGGENYVDLDEFKRLQAFEQTTNEQAVKTKKTTALNNFYTAEKVRANLQKLITKGIDLSKLEVDEQGNLTEKSAKEVKEIITTDCPDAFETVAPGTGNPAGNGNDFKGKPLSSGTLADAIELELKGN